MSAGDGSVDAELAMLLIERAARRAIFEIAVAVEAKDDDGVSIGSARLRWALAAAEHLATTSRGVLAAQFDRMRVDAAGWLPVEPLVFTADTVRRFLRRLAAQRDESQPCIDASHVELIGLDLDDLDLSKLWLRGTYLTDIVARRAIFDLADASAAYVHDCRFYAASFRLATFDGAGATDSDFSCTNLSASSWRGATLVGCTLVGASLADASLVEATFIDCDLRGATLSVLREKGHPSARAARFVRCDLRETRWSGRDLDGVSLTECKLYGAHGAPSTGDVVIEQPDLSPAGDGSRMGTRSDVIAGWADVVGRGIDRAGGEPSDRR